MTGLIEPARGHGQARAEAAAAQDRRLQRRADRRALEVACDRDPDGGEGDGVDPGADSTDPLVKTLLRKYFRDDGVSTHMHVRAGFRGIMSGLKDDFKFECEDDCSSGDLATVVPIFGFRVHICNAAFGDDNELAATIIHECAHTYDFSFGDTYCEGGCPTSMDRWDAYSNADSYSEFAQEVFAAT